MLFGIVADAGAVVRIYFDNELPRGFIEDKNCEIVQWARRELEEYFAGKRKIFSVPIRPKGGEFQRIVWKTMVENVPFGDKITYSALAELAGNPRAARAVGMANNKNPIPIIIPCHRVVGKNGKLTGFRGGLDLKQWLLDHETRKW